MASHNRTHASDRGKAVIDIPANAPTIGTALMQNITLEVTND